MGNIKEDEAVRPPFHSARLSSCGMDIVYADDVNLRRRVNRCTECNRPPSQQPPAGPPAKAGASLPVMKKAKTIALIMVFATHIATPAILERHPEKRHRVSPPAYKTRPPGCKPSHIVHEGPRDGIQILLLGGKPGLEVKAVGASLRQKLSAYGLAVEQIDDSRFHLLTAPCCVCTANGCQDDCAHSPVGLDSWALVNRIRNTVKAIEGSARFATTKHGLLIVQGKHVLYDTVMSKEA